MYRRVPEYHQKKTRIDITRGVRPYAHLGAQGGVPAVVAQAIGDLGNSLLDKGAQERKAAETALLNEYDRNAEEAFIKLAAEHADNPETFRQSAKTVFSKSGHDLPDHLKPVWKDELKRKQLRHIGPILKRSYAQGVANANASIFDNMERHRTDALNASRRGEMAISSDGKPIALGDGTPVTQAAEASSKYMIALDARTDLSPQDKARLVQRFQFDVMRQERLGFNERLVEDKGLDAAEQWVEDFATGPVPDGMNPEHRDKFASEMRQDLARLRRVDNERLRGNAGEADRIARNNLARIDAGETADPKGEENIRTLVGDEAADKYVHNVDRARARRDRFEELAGMPPAEAWVAHNALKPDPHSDTFAEDHEDWTAIGRTLEKANTALADDPVAYVSSGVRKDIEQQQGPGGSLYGASPEDLQSAQVDATLRRQGELGIKSPRLFDNQARDAMVSGFKAALSSERAALLDGLQATMGEHWPTALRELQAAGLPPEAGHAAVIAQHNADRAMTVLEGWDVRRLEPQFNPTNDTVLRDAMNTAIPPQALAGFSPEFSKGLRDTVMSAYAKLAKDAGDVSKMTNTDRLQQAIDMVTGGIVEYDRPGLGGTNPKTIAPVPGMTSNQFTDLLDGLTPTDIDEAYLPTSGRRSGGPADIDHIRRYGTLIALGNGRYGASINGMPLVRGDGGPFILDLGAAWQRVTQQGGM